MGGIFIINMTEKEAQRTKYKYDLVRIAPILNIQNSNLVIQGQSTNRENEPSGEGNTLAGKKLAPFGDLV